MTESSDVSSLKESALFFTRKEHAALLSHLTLHRGWHRYGDDPSAQSRPIENTRRAYLDAVSIGTRFVECDVHCTLDGEVVLAHDPNFRLQAEDPESTLANTPIAQLPWSEVSTLLFQDQSSPTLLSTVLEDLLETGVVMAIEIKDKESAHRLVSLLSDRPELIPSVGLVMSFDFDEVEKFHDGFLKHSHQQRLPFPIAWLICNPANEEKYELPYYTYTPAKESFDSFLIRIGFLERFRVMHCGVYIQQNSSTSTQQLGNMRQTVADVISCSRSDVFIGLWNDSSSESDLDSPRRVAELGAHVSCINTDLPTHFFIA